MVDPTKGIGPVQGLISGTRVTDNTAAKRAGETKETPGPKDEVALSPKALGAAQAEDVSAKVRTVLEKDTSLTLSRGEGFDESL